MSTEHDPLFILSCHRSGSTLLRFALDAHPEIYCPPELFLGEAAFAWVIFLAGLVGSKAKEASSLDPGLKARARQLLSAELERATALKGKRIWCEKTPDNLEHLGLIDELFAGARYLCLYRHGFDVVSSGLEMNPEIPALLPFLYASRGHSVTALMRYWVEWTTRLLRFEESRPNQCHRLYYETLVTEPAVALAGVFSFLGLEFPENLVDATFSSEHDKGAEDFKVRENKGFHRDSIGRGADLPLHGVPEKILEDVSRVLAQLGYSSRPGVAGARVATSNTPAVEGTGSGVDLEAFFANHVPRLLAQQPQVASKIGFVYRLKVTGAGGGDWLVDARAGQARACVGVEHADCTIQLSTPDLWDLISRRLAPQIGLRDGRIRIEGVLKSESLLSLLGLFQTVSSP